MANRVYLCFTNFPRLPGSDEWEAFVESSSKAELEAKAAIPLYWLLMFDESDIQISLPDDFNLDLDARPYAYLVTEKEKALFRLEQWKPILEKLGKDQPQIVLYREWVNRVLSEQFQYVIVRTEELSWFDSTEGELEKNLRNVFGHLACCRMEGDLRLNRSLVDLIGLWDQEQILDSESYQLAGSSTGKDEWPKPFAAKIILNSPDGVGEEKNWVNWGLIVISIPLILSLIASFLSDAIFGVSYFRINAIWGMVTILSSPIIWRIGKRLNSGKPRGAETKKRMHTVFWIPVEYFSFPIFLLGVFWLSSSLPKN